MTTIIILCAVHCTMRSQFNSICLKGTNGTYSNEANSTKYCKYYLLHFITCHSTLVDRQVFTGEINVEVGVSCVEKSHEESMIFCTQ